MSEPNTFNFSLSDLKSTGFGGQSFKMIDKSKSDQTSISFTEGVDRASTNNTDNAWGINHRQIPLALQQSRDNYGLVFFTRPQLNLQDYNCRRDRKFSRLLTDNPLSVQRMVRCLLDPRLQYNETAGIEGQTGNSFSGDFTVQNYINCPLVDEYQAFIPFLTNNIQSLNGFPDLRASTYSAKEGPYKEAYSFIDGPTDDFTEFDITGTFRNTQGDPISALAFNWIHYGSKVHEGLVTAYSDFILNREIDYNTRIYRFVLDPSKRFIQRMAMTGASYPYALGNGGFYDYESATPFNEASNTVQIPFKSLGAIYEDDLIIRAFNDVVSYFHPMMKTNTDLAVSPPDSTEMIKIPWSHLHIFNHRGYPWIDPATYELQWYVSREYYETKLASHSEFLNTLYLGAGIGL